MRTTRSRTRDEYLPWLYEKVGIGIGDREDFVNSLEHLHSIDFQSLVPNDDNRGDDGRDLRYQFERETGIQADHFVECSVLEMLVALSHRMAYICADLGEDESRADIHFWQMIENLGMVPDDPRKNERAIRDLLDRKYKPDGSGGLFPIRRPKKDQRQVEIWYQMMDYIGENLF